jgi:hypothetical protein
MNPRPAILDKLPGRAWMATHLGEISMKKQLMTIVAIILLAAGGVGLASAMSGAVQQDLTNVSMVGP